MVIHNSPIAQTRYCFSLLSTKPRVRDELGPWSERTKLPRESFVELECCFLLSNGGLVVVSIGNVVL